MHVFINLIYKLQLHRNIDELSFFLIHIGPTMHLNIILPKFYFYCIIFYCIFSLENTINFFK